MLKTTINAWVKNVNKLRVNSSKNSAVSSPVYLNTITTQMNVDVQLPVILFSIHQVNSTISTLKIKLLYLLEITYTHNPHPLLLEPLNIN